MTVGALSVAMMLLISTGAARETRTVAANRGGVATRAQHFTCHRKRQDAPAACTRTRQWRSAALTSYRPLLSSGHIRPNLGRTPAFGAITGEHHGRTEWTGNRGRRRGPHA